QHIRPPAPGSVAVDELGGITVRRGRSKLYLNASDLTFARLDGRRLRLDTPYGTRVFADGGDDDALRDVVAAVRRMGLSTSRCTVRVEPLRWTESTRAWVGVALYSAAFIGFGIAGAAAPA